MPSTQIEDELLEGTWSESVANDPKHRPQTLDKPATTARREWSRWPQEAHLLDLPNNRYRRLNVKEISRIQGFPDDWVMAPSVSDRDRIAALGNAVPPHLSRVIFETIDERWQWQNKTSIEICAGIGGLAIGASAIGLEHLALVEIWDPACNILRHEKPWPSDAVRVENINSFAFENYASKLGVLSGGPPCQPWSQSGRRKGALDPRDLFGHLPRMIARCRPEVIIIENVPGLITNKQHIDYFNSILDQLAEPIPGELEYGIAKGILNAADFGVPQTRRRLFIIGFRGKSFTFASGVFGLISRRETHCDPQVPTPGKRPWITLGEAFNGLPDPEGWREYSPTTSVNKSTSSPMSGQNQLEPSGPAGETAILTSEAVSQLRGAVPMSLPEQSPSTSSNTTQSIGGRKLSLEWPTKGLLPDLSGDRWTVVSPTGINKIHPLLPIEDFGEHLPGQQTVHAVLGNRLDALSTLAKRFGGAVKLAYYDSPRIDTIETVQPGFVNSIWIGMLHEWAMATRLLLARDGVFVLHVDDASYHYGRMALEDVFGPNNYIATFVWQKKYGPQNDLEIPTAAQDYLIVFAGNRSYLPTIGIPTTSENLTDDGDPRGHWRAGHKGAMSGTEETKFQYYAPPYRWELADGELPPGLWRVSPESGVIWGTPSTPGTFDFRVRVSDAEGNSATAKLSIKVAETGDPKLEEEVWWIDRKNVKKGGKLQVSTRRLTNGVMGKEYSAVLVAQGGTPYKNRLDKNKKEVTKPGSGRFWEFSKATLVRNILLDCVYFGAKGNALPSVKKHDEEERIIKELTWWRYELVGKSEDASKHLKELADRKLIKEAPRIAKPEKLMKRILMLFARADGDFVLDLSDPTASMASAAIKLRRNVILLAGESTREKQLWRDCALPRLQAVIDGNDNSDAGISKDEDVMWEGGGRVEILEVGAPFIIADPKLESCEVNIADYPPDSEIFMEAICSVSGFKRVLGSDVDGEDDWGNACVIVPPGDCLSEMQLGRYVSQLLPGFKRLTILFECSYVRDTIAPPENVFLQHFPFDLVG